MLYYNTEKNLNKLNVNRELFFLVRKQMKQK